MDRDGLLNRDEIAAFSRGEFGFELSGESLDRIWRTLRPADSPGGLASSQMSRLKTAVKIAVDQDKGKRLGQTQMPMQVPGSFGGGMVGNPLPPMPPVGGCGGVMPPPPGGSFPFP